MSMLLVSSISKITSLLTSGLSSGFARRVRMKQGMVEYRVCTNMRYRSGVVIWFRCRETRAREAREARYSVYS